MKYISIPLISLLALLNINCTVNSSESHWFDNLIDKFMNEPVGNPPQSIWQYSYKGEIVYYVPAQCCDQFSTLYDASGNIICAPDGGFSGAGNGACTDFFEKRKDEKLIWQDTRKSDRVQNSEAIILWRGDYAADGCGFFIKINDKEFKAENESIIGDEYRTSDSSRVMLRFRYLNKDIEYQCGDLPHANRLEGIKIISIEPR